MSILDKIIYINSFKSYGEYTPYNFFRHLQNHYYKHNIRPKGPISVSWNLTNSCNLQCFFCSNSSNSKPIVKNKVLQFNKIVDFIIESKVLYVQLLGGEPTLNKNFIDIMEKLVNNGVFVELVTNGVGINEGNSERLAQLDNSLFRIKISLDSCEEVINDNTRGNGSFKIAIEALSILSKVKIKNLRVQSVITKETKHTIFMTYKFLHNFNVNSYGFTVLLPTGSGNEEDVPILDNVFFDNIIKIIDEYNKNRKITIEKFHYGYIHNLFNDDENMSKETSDFDQNCNFKKKCTTGIIKLNIDENGDVYPCDYLRFKEFNLGNIENSSIYDIWNNPKLLEIVNIKRSDKKVCSTCNNLKCNTGCMGLAFEKYSDIKYKDPNCLKKEGCK